MSTTVFRALRNAGAIAIATGLPACTQADTPSALARASDSGPPPAPSAAARASPPAPTEPDDTGVDPNLCAAICARSEPLHCAEAASCVRRCQVMQHMPVCQGEIRGALGCFAATPPGGWTCNPHGLPSVNVGHCDPEQSRAAKCLAAHPPSPIGANGSP